MIHVNLVMVKQLNILTFLALYILPGVTLTFTAKADQLDIKYQFDHNLENITQGLLGNYNGDPSDDLIPQGSTVSLDTATATDRQIYYDFGETCKSLYSLMNTQHVH